MAKKGQNRRQKIEPDPTRPTPILTELGVGKPYAQAWYARWLDGLVDRPFYRVNSRG